MRTPDHLSFILSTLLFALFTLNASAQWHIGNDFGFVSFDAEDERVSTLRYENVVGTAFQPGLIYSSKKIYVNISFGVKDATLKPVEDNARFESEWFFQNYELDIEYFRKVKELKTSTSVFLGVSHYGHFSYYDVLIKSSFGNSTVSSHEMSAVNIALGAMIRQPVSNHQFQYRIGYSLFNYGSRPENTSNDFNLSRFKFDEYSHLMSSLSGIINLSDRWVFKPEYRMRFYTYDRRNEARFLKQSFLVGLYIKL